MTNALKFNPNVYTTYNTWAAAYAVANERNADADGEVYTAVKAGVRFAVAVYDETGDFISNLLEDPAG